ncbi:MAG: GDP-mannose 4,6-dehydratase [Nitrospirota bacterium]|nr:GDP-mannose 4,6-dehydratase [Nitrospirota bacterium]
MTVLVTGAAGFIGSHLCEALLVTGREVVGLDNFDPFYDRADKQRNLAGLTGRPGFTLVEADILDHERLQATFSAHAVDEVVHLAALAGVRPSIQNPLRYQQVNVTGTAHVLECARIAGVRNLVFASSSSVYGNNDKVPFAETDPVDHPISPYAATKKAGELMAHCWHHLYGFPVTCLRFFTVYGPRQRPDLAIASFTRRIDRGQPIPLYGDGSSCRDYTYIDDIVRGTVVALEHPRPYVIYNLGGSETTRLTTLVELIEQALGRQAVRKHLPPQPGDVKATWADISHAREGLGYTPATPLADGIRRYVNWYRTANKGINP